MCGFDLNGKLAIFENQPKQLSKGKDAFHLLWCVELVSSDLEAGRHLSFNRAACLILCLCTLCG